jgi:hypothetical protein
MENQVDVKVVKRDKSHEKGLFKKGAEITIDLDDMEAYHSGLTWNVRKCENGLFKLNGFETYMEIYARKRIPANGKYQRRSSCNFR